MDHISDHDLLLEIDGELDPSRLNGVEAHLAECAECRSRQDHIFRTLSEAVQECLERDLPPPGKAREQLQSRLTRRGRQRYLALAALAAALTLVVLQFLPPSQDNASPRAALTPGAVLTTNAITVCESETERPPIANAVAMEVFRKYGIHDPRPRAYEVDYLIPPDLGGANEFANLWPQPYDAGVWNARVKDALEDRLRSMVCAGTLPIETAQREIAVDWIAAYKKFFRTNQPLPDHIAFSKDRPWE